MTASEAFAEQPAAEGVALVPGIVGSAYMDALDLFPAAGIRFLPVAHEQNAVHMADGYAHQIVWHGDRYAGTNLTNPEFAGVAAALGALGITMCNDRDPQPALHDAITSGYPAVLSFLTGPHEPGEPFRRDALKYPIRHPPTYAHLNT